MDTIVKRTEDRIASLLGRRYCVLTHSGTTALYLAYSLLNKKRSNVVLPALICAAPLWAVHYAKKIPVFCDVLEKDATIDPARVDEIIKKDKKIGMVVAAHLYGNPADLAQLRSVCHKRDVVLIEDLAQALGGIFDDGQVFGSQGDCSIVSFSYSKILDVGSGGAFLTDDRKIADSARRLNVKLLGKADKDGSLALIYRRLFYAVWESGQKDERFYAFFDLFPDLFRSLFIQAAGRGSAQGIFQALRSLDEEVSWRRKIAKVYRDGLKDLKQVRIISSTSGVPWRFCFCVPAPIRQQLLERVRAKNYDISAWYPSIVQWTLSGRKQNPAEFPVASRIEKEIVNLWVGRSYDEKKAAKLIQIIKGVLV